MVDRIDKEIAKLEGLDLDALKARWVELFERPAPKWCSRDLMLRAHAYYVQEQDVGGLSRAARRRLAELAVQMKGGHAETVQPPSRPSLKAGTRLIREWNGALHQVSVLDDGFEYRGDRYRSLSQVARKITGARWSGPRFFGLHQAKQASADGS